jgi:hypothetical protein
MSSKMNLIVALVGSAALVLGACEEKNDGSSTTKSVTGAIKDAGKAAADKAADTTKKAGEAVKDGAEKAKEAVKEGADKAAAAAGEMLTKAKDWGNGYSEQLGALATKLEGIKTKDDATKALPEIKPIMDKVNGFIENLNKLSPEMKSSLMGDWKAKLDPIVSKFQSQLDRLMKDDAIKSVLGDTFKNFKLFQ